MDYGRWSTFADSIRLDKYAHVKPDGTQEFWGETAHRVASNVFSVIPKASVELTRYVEKLIADRKFIPGGRYLAATGRELKQVNNCLLLRAEDSREGWSDLLHKIGMSLMTGAGVGVVYSDLRERGAIVRRTGGTATGPCALMQMVNECGRGIIQGGNRRSALWAGLHWNHPDIFEFIAMKNWTPEVRALKEKNYNFPATMDGTNISVILDDAFFSAYHNTRDTNHTLAHRVYWAVIRQMLETAEPGFSIDAGKNSGENNRNACTELTSATDSDVCNLGSLNLARIESPEEMRYATEAATAFLLAGTVYSDVPYPRVAIVRDQNRRIGLGLMGIAEWLQARGKVYGPDPELQKYLEIYAENTGMAHRYADEWSLSRSVKTRALAPTGTIGIVGETTTGIEPILCAAYKRRYIKNGQVNFQYVLDPTAKRLVETGIPVDSIEDAYKLAETPERRVAFQSWVQQYVDHGISSTINLPAWGSTFNNPDRVTDFGEMLLKHLPNLRGLTCYPDGARSGQPIESVPYAIAAKYTGEIFVESMDVCDLTRGGTCGS